MTLTLATVPQISLVKCGLKIGKQYLKKKSNLGSNTSPNFWSVKHTELKFSPNVITVF